MPPFVYPGHTLTRPNADLDALLGGVPAGRAAVDLKTYLSNNIRYSMRDAGAAANGVTNDYAKFVAAQAVVGATGELQVTPGTHLIGANITFTQTLHFSRGAKLKPGAGVIIRIMGPITGLSHLLWDLSDGGQVLFYDVDGTPNGYMLEVNGWWWLTGDGITAEQTAYSAMHAALPNETVINLNGGRTLLFTDTATVGPGRENLRLTTGRDPRQGRLPLGDGQVLFKWGGAAGGTFLFYDSCTFCVIEGVSVDMGTADTFLKFDGANGHISSTNALRYFVIACTTPRATQKVISLSATINTNGDFMTIEHGVMNSFGGVYWSFPQNFACVNGNIAVTEPNIQPAMQGKRVRIEGAGVAGATLDTTFATAGSGTGTLAVAPSATGTFYGIVSEGKGTAIYCGPNGNAHKTTFRDLNIAGFAKAIDFQNGTYRSEYMQFTNCDLNWNVVSAGESSEINTRVEFCNQHINSGAGKPLMMWSSVFDVERTMPGSSFMVSTGPGHIFMFGCTTENALPGTTHFADIAQSRRLALFGCVFSPALTLARLLKIFGAPAVPGSPFFALFCDGISDVVGGTVYGFPVFGVNPIDFGNFGANQFMPTVDLGNDSPEFGWRDNGNNSKSAWLPRYRVSADRGDNNVNLVWGTDEPTQYFNTPLTAGRVVTMSVVNSSGQAPPSGAKFRTVRSANATGAFNLTVAGKNLAVGQWVEHEWNGAGWVETAFGSL